MPGSARETRINEVPVEGPGLHVQEDGPNTSNDISNVPVHKDSFDSAEQRDRSGLVGVPFPLQETK